MTTFSVIVFKCKNFANLKQLLGTIKYNFKIICLTETCCQWQHLNRKSFDKGGDLYGRRVYVSA